MSTTTSTSSTTAPAVRQVDDRAFGVEMEMTHCPEGALRREFEQRGLILSNYPGGRDSSTWALKYDGSVAGDGRELVSPILRGADGFRQLQLVGEALSAVGARTGISAGLHVHLDTENADLDTLKRLHTSWKANQEHIKLLVSPSRRDRTWCADLNDNDSERVQRCTTKEELRTAGHQRYKSLNYAALGAHGTVEIRLHQGTVNTEKVAQWVRFCQRMMRIAAEGTTLDRATDFTAFLVSLDDAGLHRYYRSRSRQLNGGQRGSTTSQPTEARAVVQLRISWYRERGQSVPDWLRPAAQRHGIAV